MRCSACIVRRAVKAQAFHSMRSMPNANSCSIKLKNVANHKTKLRLFVYFTYNVHAAGLKQPSANLLRLFPIPWPSLRFFGLNLSAPLGYTPANNNSHESSRNCLLHIPGECWAHSRVTHTQTVSTQSLSFATVGMYGAYTADYLPSNSGVSFFCRTFCAFVAQ